MKRVFVMVMSLAAVTSSALYAADAAPTPAHEPTPAERYGAECGTCHMAYPAGFLPARSWQRLMGNLGNHFGDNAELSDATRQQITQYLLANAGDKTQDRHAARFAASAPAGETPLRITELPAFKHQHHEIPQRYIKNAQVGSLSNCTACHTRAAQGSFREREISIPGKGHWEDD